MTQRYAPHITDEEERLAARVIALATQYGRYGYRRIAALLKEEEWQVNHKKIERIWKMEGLKVPKKQPKRRRLWLNDGSCIRLRPGYMEKIDMYSRNQYLKVLRKKYLKAMTRKEKTQILGEYCYNISQARKYIITS